MRSFRISIGKGHNAKVRKTATCSFSTFSDSLLSKVPETADKASNGWICPAAFDPQYRDSENFVERNLLSFDYDHILPEDLPAILECYKKYAYLAFTTWSHTPEKPRLRVWLPVSRPMAYDEFQAISRRVAAEYGIEKMARESHTPSQYYFRPTVKPFEELQSWKSDAPWVDADEVLSTYDNWTDRSSWPHRAEGDGVHNEGSATDPRTKPGIVGAFCRAFSISEAIEKFGLPYKPGSSEGRLTYTDGSRPDGAIIYDDDTKLHSHHDTDPARGQTNAYDLVRLHRFGWLDSDVGGSAQLAQRASSVAMRDFVLQEGAVASQLVADEGFEDLDATDTSWLDAETEANGAVGTGPSSVGTNHLPERIAQASSKLTDQENARRVQRRFGDKIISVGRTFFCWTGTHWAKDDAQALRRVTFLSQIVKAEAIKIKEEAEAKGEKLEDSAFADFWRWSVECAQKAKISNCESLLRSLLSFDAKQLNTSAHLLSCANGTLDLRSGTLQPHDPRDFITACSPIAFNVNAEAPRFQRFLLEIYNGDSEVVEFAKRWFGYCLTGSTNEHKMVFHVGRGGNGKSTLMDLLKYVLGDGYYSTAPQKILSAEEQGATPDLADLLGRRMVTIAETDESLELREGLVKQITGGDPIKARELYKAPFEFMPTHKLQVFTNFAPAIKSQDFAMWRRIILLNYPISYGDSVQVARGDATKIGDPHLDDALKAEAPGVLKWLVDGAREWYAGRLRPPPSVLEATHRYREDQDTIGQFAKQRIETDVSAWTALAGTAESVFPAYRGWCNSMNIRPLGRNRFVREILRVVQGSTLQSRKEGTSTVTGFLGFRLTGDALTD